MAEDWLARHKATYDRQFTKCTELCQAAQELLSSLSVDRANARDVFLVTLFIRVLQLYEGAILLTQFGLGPASRTVTRAQLEAVFVLGAVSRDNGILARYVAGDDLRRLKVVRAIENSRSSVLDVLKVGHIGQLKVDLEARVKDESVTQIRTEELARIAEMQDWYDTAYRLLSGAVHSSTRDLERALVIGDEGLLQEIRGHPSDDDTYLVITTSSNLLVLSAERLAAAMGQGKMESVMRLKRYFLELSRPAVQRLRRDV